VPSAQPKATVPPPPVDALVERKSYAGWDLNIILLLAMEVQPKIISERERERDRKRGNKKDQFCDVLDSQTGYFIAA